MNFEEEINRQTQEKFMLRIKDAVLNKNSGVCRIELFYKDGVILSQADRENIERLAIKLLPRGFSYEFKFIKNFVVNEAVSDFVKKYLKNNFPAISFSVDLVDCENEQKRVVVSVDSKAYEYAKERKIVGELSACLLENFYSNIAVELNEREDTQDDFVAVENTYVFDEEPPESNIEVSEVVKLIGELSETNASKIKDKKSPEEAAVICGKIQYIKECAFERKQKSKEAEGEETSEQKYFKFTIDDQTGKMPCVIFATKKTYEPLLTLKQGDEIIVSGQIAMNKFKDSLDMKVKEISRCKIISKPEEIVYKDEPENYRFVFPEPVEYYSQVDLFTTGEKKIHPFFLDHDVVVFDFETTGLALDGSDKILEIGAVKVVKGKIVESFSCLIDPEMHIPADSTKTHGITDDDVKGKPTYEQVLPDFYKFTRGCYLSGYNIIGFDMIFLTHFGNLCRYNFDNPVIDVYKLALKSVRGVKNYKLGTIAEKLGVALDHAHRAVFDTIATAEVLFKLSESLESLEN